MFDVLINIYTDIDALCYRLDHIVIDEENAARHIEAEAEVVSKECKQFYDSNAQAYYTFISDFTTILSIHT